MTRSEMTIYSLYIFNRHCNIIHHSNYCPETQHTLSFSEQTKLIYGVVFSLDTLLQKLFGTTYDILFFVFDLGRSDSFESYSTNVYSVHYFNSPTSIRVIAFSTPGILDMNYIFYCGRE